MCTSRPRVLPPPPPPPQASRADPGAQAGVSSAAAREAAETARRRRATGLSATVLTGGLGLQDQASVSRKTLLGQ